MDDKTLQRLQLIELEILKKIDSICQKNNLRYFFVGGTLLGAVRHGGFIPWDDDLDIAIPRSDYNQFINLCINGALGKEYSIQDILTYDNYWIPFAKVRKNNTLFKEEALDHLDCHKGIFVDVFPLDYCKRNTGAIYHLKAKTIKKINFIIKSRVLNIESPNTITSILNLALRPFSVKFLSKVRDRIAMCKNGIYYINYGSNYKYTNQTMPIDIYEPAVKIKFENEYFNAPHEYEQYLVNLFINWNTMPQEEERRNHNPVKIIFDTAKESE